MAVGLKSRGRRYRSIDTAQVLLCELTEDGSFALRVILQSSGSQISADGWSKIFCKVSVPRSLSAAGPKYFAKYWFSGLCQRLVQHILPSIGSQVSAGGWSKQFCNVLVLRFVPAAGPEHFAKWLVEQIVIAAVFLLQSNGETMTG